MPTPIIIDCDPGHDDAFAILLAARAPELKLLAITAVAGNQTLDKTALNARRIATVGGIRNVPIAAGMDRPLVRPLVTAPYAHGESGLDGYDFGPPEVDLVPEYGVDLIIRTVKESPEPVTLVPVGPLTNVAMAFLQAPEIKQNISRIVLMGGSASGGNVTPSAEFNIYVDPEAAANVFEAGVPIMMVGLDVTYQARFRAEDRARIRALGSTVGTMVADLMDWFGRGSETRFGSEGTAVHDALAVAAVIRPDLLETRHVHVAVEAVGKYTDGRTVCDLRPSSASTPNADVALGVNREAFVELLIEGLARY
jgi:purine nucleosidase/pyrimidine-specific ribonucleoside hydrolase